MVSLVFWFPPTRKAKAQFLLGMSIYWFVGPFLTILVLLYALYHLDHFSWGKTRQVIVDVESGGARESVMHSAGSSITLEAAEENPR